MDGSTLYYNAYLSNGRIVIVPRLDFTMLFYRVVLLFCFVLFCCLFGEEVVGAYIHALVCWKVRNGKD